MDSSGRDTPVLRPRWSTYRRRNDAGTRPGWHTETTEADGRFAIPGLLDQSYVIVAHDPSTLARVEVEARPGDSSTEIVFDRERLWRRVAGHVVDRTGAPIANVLVGAATDTFFARYQGLVVETSHGRADSTATTGEDGAFELRDIGRDLVYLRIDGEEILSVDWGRHTEGGLAELSDGNIEDLEVVASVRMHLQVHLRDPEEADGIRVLDSNGEAILINLILADNRWESPEMPLKEGRSEVLTGTDGAATLVLLHDGEEVRRVPLTLQRGTVNRMDV